MTHEEIREIDAYCEDRGIELVPNQNSFGHMERWLKHEQYKEIAECPEGFDHPISGWRKFGSTLHPSKESLNAPHNDREFQRFPWSYFQS